MTLHHVAICVKVRGERVGLVVSADTISKAIKSAERLSNREGYVGGDSFSVAVKRAGMMERNESGAWGSIAEEQTREQ